MAENLSFNRIAFVKIAGSFADIIQLADKLRMPLSELVLRLEGSKAFTIEEALDLIRESDDTDMLRWVMARLGMRRIEIDPDDESATPRVSGGDGGELPQKPKIKKVH
jgi:hypothetical protein